MNERVLNFISYGVYVVSTFDGERPTGCVANSIMQVTAVPATLAVSMSRDNFTHKCMKDTKKFAISILTEESDPGLIGRFGFQSGKDIDKFEGIDYEIKGGLPIITDACGYILCEVVDFLETETHSIILANIVDGDIIKQEPVMTYSYYHTVVKGKSPKNAPTYQSEEVVDENKTVYKCAVCGYVYDGEIPFEELPDDYVCPICKKPKAVFVEQ